MKTFISFLMMVCALSVAHAQNAIEMAQQQQELNKVLMKTLNSKPTKEAKKQAKELKKAGWTVPAGERSIEQQITTSQLLSSELMIGENGTPTRRFIQHTGISTAGTYNVAYSAGRSNAQAEIASMLSAEIVAAIAAKLDNDQQNATDAITNEQFNQRVKSLVQGSLTNSIPVMAIYRVLNNKNYEVQVRIAFDRNEVTNKLKKELKSELEVEGDQLNEIVDNAFNALIN